MDAVSDGDIGGQLKYRPDIFVQISSCRLANTRACSSEWSAATRAELAAFFDVTSRTMLGITGHYRMPMQDVLPEMYERWKRSDGTLSRDRVRVLMEEWLEKMAEREAALREAMMQHGIALAAAQA